MRKASSAQANGIMHRTKTFEVVTMEADGERISYMHTRFINITYSILLVVQYIHCDLCLCQIVYADRTFSAQSSLYLL